MMGFLIKAGFVSCCWRGFGRRPPEMGHNGADLVWPGVRDVESGFGTSLLFAVGVSGSFAQLDVRAGRTSSMEAPSDAVALA
eukprot:1528338-Prorocentrum_lima.AAC.1